MRLNHFSISEYEFSVCVRVCLYGHIDAFIEVRKIWVEKTKSRNENARLERVEHPLIIILMLTHEIYSFYLCIHMYVHCVFALIFK